MPSDLSNYLATRYLVADPKPSKKRKRKQDPSSAGLVIADDDESGWTRASHNANEDEDSAVVAGTSADFRKAKKSAWKVVGSNPSPSPNQPDPTPTSAEAQAADSAQRADAILASAAAEASEQQASTSLDDAPTIMMSDGSHAGLQTAAAVSAQLAARRKAERSAYASDPTSQKEGETIYRDATGRRVDVSMKRAELRRAAQEAEAAEAAKKEALKGDVQVEAARRRREELEDAKVMAVARHADDLDLNREMKEKVRWGDTMAQFIEPRGSGGGGGGGNGGGAKRKMKGKPVYQGAWAPNRYGIKPGYRWDGVDRGNGFEAERFKAINRRERNKGLEYSWQMDE